MIHVPTLAQIPPTNSPTLLTIGAFDGVHRGHQTLLTNLVTRARAQNYRAALVTFFPHPVTVLRGRMPSFYLTSVEEKAERLAALGIDLLITHPFDQQVAQITASDFLTQLQHALNFKELWCGHDFAFGHNREGNVAWLQTEASKRGFTVQLQSPLTTADAVISSSRIRAEIAKGNLPLVAELLGRPFSLSAKVVEGNKRGRTIGIPTANLEIWEERIYPAKGVYACRATVNGRTYEAVTNIGVRPTFENQAQLSVEAHLLNFNQDIYGQTITLHFIAHLRDEKKFNGLNELVAQIQKDIEQAKTLLNSEVRSQNTEAGE